MDIFSEILKSWKDFEEIEKALPKHKGVLEITGCVDAAKPHIIYGLKGAFRSRLVLVPSELRATELFEELSFFDPNTVYFPAKDVLFYQADVKGGSLMRERLSALRKMRDVSMGLNDEEITVVTPFDTLMNRMPNPAVFEASTIRLAVGDELDLKEFSARLVSIGYEREYQASAPGTFAVRGGIIDIYTLNNDHPFRIELFGDEIDSIREYDPESQRSIDSDVKDVAVIGPASDNLFAEKDDGKNYTILDYMIKDNTLVFLDEPYRMAEHGKAVELEYTESMKLRYEKGLKEMATTGEITSCELAIERVNECKCIALSLLQMKANGFNIKKCYTINSRTVNAYNNSFDLLVKDLKSSRKHGKKTIVLSASHSRAIRIAKDLYDEEINSYFSETRDHELKETEVMVLYGKLKKGFEYPDFGFSVISDSDIFGREAGRKKKKFKRFSGGEAIKSFNDLHVGDYVVHENHGLGIYRGIEKMDVDGITKDYMKIEYAKGANLYILATQFELVQKYAKGNKSEDDKKLKLNSLGSQEWSKTKTKVKHAVEEIATELVELYAIRQEKEGFVCGEDTVWQKEFEEQFPFEETEDQINAINDTKRDMESTKIMDRLVCGDVGFGKTEVAIRAAFKAVTNSKQVIYLCPTTILAQQHYNTFAQRMKDYPITVELLSRFRTPTQQKKTIENLKKGMVDIVIGTHRVLSKDVEFKDLGLLIVDEEQRFGVTHKEKIKQLKKNVDVLTLTATPIPRTLHMSLIGIRDMSILEEPPLDRVPIQTYVMEYNDELVREAIERELARDGQVYYVYNKVKNIAEIAAGIQRMIPDANVAYAHGQMKETELEQIMYAFINGEIDVLVSTTIIETGLDISNVNTMIIRDADNMGLSQLYQLRGRVGRSNRTAYAFFMYKRDKVLKEVAEKRLAAIREFTDLGSGFKIAMRDLEIRGAGNILGESQSGHMEAVGYDLYCKMLNEAVKLKKGILEEKDTFETEIDINIDAFIPDSYISNEFEKLDMYKRISAIENDKESEDIIDELIDRYGEPGKSVLNLVRIAKIKAKAHSLYVIKITAKGNTVNLEMSRNAPVKTENLENFIKSYEGALIFIPSAINPNFLYKANANNREKEMSITGAIDILLNRMALEIF